MKSACLQTLWTVGPHLSHFVAMPAEFLSVTDAAHRARISRRTLQRWLASGQLRKHAGGKVAWGAVMRCVKAQRRGRPCGSIALPEREEVQVRDIAGQTALRDAAPFFITDGLRSLRFMLRALVLHVIYFGTEARRQRLREIIMEALENCDDPEKAKRQRFRAFAVKSEASISRGLNGSLRRARLHELARQRGQKPPRTYWQDIMVSANAYKPPAKEELMRDRDGMPGVVRRVKGTKRAEFIRLDALAD